MALRTTIDAIRAICTTDPSINSMQVNAAIAELNGEGLREMMGEPPPRAYSRQQVATLLGTNPKTITAYARRGLLVPIYSGTGGKRARAYTGESVAALLSGKVSSRG